VQRRRDELGELAQDFDFMAERVESLVSAQQRLLQDVSHELRSPLARLSVALELALRDAGPAAAPALGRVGREAERLNELIGQLLTLVRLEGGAAPQQVRIELSQLVAEIADDADFEATAHDRRVRVAGCDVCEVVGVPELLRSAIENVLRNAVQHTAAGSAVDVTLRRQISGAAPIATLEVRDHGPGVPEEALDAIFKPFYRVSDARERSSGGVGLGLAITARAIHLHGGVLRARNAPDGGLIVQIDLPCAPN
jgi:two-component system sensor histidine kinase CpxA